MSSSQLISGFCIIARFHIMRDWVRVCKLRNMQLLINIVTKCRPSFTKSLSLVYIDPVVSKIMHLSMLSCWERGGGGGGGGRGGNPRPGIGGGFELRSVFLFKCPAPGKSSWVKKCKFLIPGSFSLDKRPQRLQMIKSPYHGQTCNIKFPSYAHPPPPQRLNIDRCIKPFANVKIYKEM